MNRFEPLSSLGTAHGLARLSQELGTDDSSSSSAAEVQDIILRQLEENPELADLPIRLQPGIPGGYFPGQESVSIGVLDPDVMAHELGHAKNLRHTQIYSKLLDVTGKLSKINKYIALPAMLTIRALVSNPEARNELMNTLTSVSAMIAAPGLAEEMSASLDATRQANDKGRALRRLIPAFLKHMVAASTPATIYQSGKYM
jgi:hypothetical protein